jgi:NADH dehydrogenase
LARSKEKAASALPVGQASGNKLHIVLGDAADPTTADQLMSGAQACINLVGIIREESRSGQTFRRMHVEVPRVLTGACERSSVKRFLHMSALGVRETGGAAYQRSKFEGESVVRRSGLDWTILRPGLIHGEGSEFMTQAHEWMTGHAPPFVFLPYFTGGNEDERVPLGGVNPRDARIAPVHVDDVCAAFLQALRAPHTVGEVYNLAGEEVMTWPEMLRSMKEATPGALPLSPFGIPSEIGAIVAKGASLIGLGSFLPFDEGMAIMAAEDSTCDLTKAREDLAFRPRPFLSSYREYARSAAH